MKNLKNLGEALSKAEQKMINGGRAYWKCYYENCPAGPCGLSENWCIE